jgi:hypothetical protein
VVDVSDREPQNGELFLIQRASGARSRHIRQLKSDLLNITGSGRAKSLVWWISDLAGFRPILESNGAHFRKFKRPQWRTLAAEYLAAKAQHDNSEKLFHRASRIAMKLIARRVDDDRAYALAGVGLADERNVRAYQAQRLALERLRDHLRGCDIVDRVLAIGIVLCADVPNPSNNR